MARTGRHRPRGARQRAHDHARPSSSPPTGPCTARALQPQCRIRSRLPAAPKQSSRPEGRIRAAAQPGCQQARPLIMSNPLGQLPLVPRGPKKTHSRSNTQAGQRAAQQIEEGLLQHWINRACSTLPIQDICEACPFIFQALRLQ